MSVFRPLSTSEQLANFLKEEILNGKLHGKMPGVKHLVHDLGVNSEAVSNAMAILESQGLLVQRGARKSAMILMPQKPAVAKALRFQVLLYDNYVGTSDYLVEMKHELIHAGHSVEFSRKSLQDLNMDPVLVKRHVEESEADAWIVVSGSQAVLRWFAGQPFPAFSVFGISRDIDIASAGPQKAVLMESIVRHLVKLGHRRIVMLCRQEGRKPKPMSGIEAFLAALETNGITAGAYHLPDWGDTKEEFYRGLENLFRLTPPTALICSYPLLFVAVQNFLAKQGMNAPRDISLICLEMVPALAWCNPPVAHVSWDRRPLVRRVIRWAANVAAGKDDRKMERIPAKFVEGGSIGKAAI